jgi:uncharacterized protein YybS (DUF2232 family)
MMKNYLIILIILFILIITIYYLAYGLNIPESFDMKKLMKDVDNSITKKRNDRKRIRRLFRN